MFLNQILGIRITSGAIGASMPGSTLDYWTSVFKHCLENPSSAGPGIYMNKVVLICLFS